MIQPPPVNSRCTATPRATLFVVQQCGMSKAYRKTYIREWRQKRGYSLERLASMIPMDKGNLSKIERGILQYNQELLERLAEALRTEPASLLMRDPTDPDGIWSVWDRAKPGEREQIVKVAEALVGLKEAS